jgi:hypothetical protein
LYTLYLLYTRSASKASACPVQRLFSLGGSLVPLTSGTPLSLHHPPGGTWDHHPSPLRGERAARACASCVILLKPPSGACWLCTSADSRPSPCDRLLTLIDSRPTDRPGESSTAFSMPLKHAPAGPRPSISSACPSSCSQPASSDPVPTVCSSLRSTPSVVKAFCRLTPRLVTGSPPRIAAAGRRRAGQSVRLRKERKELVLLATRTR